MSRHKMTTETLLLLGFAADHSGFRYLVYGLDLIFADDTLLTSITCSLYPAIAQKYAVTPGSVERCIRFAIGHAWAKGGRKQWQKYFGQEIAKQPGNARLIATMHELLTPEAEQLSLFSEAL